MANSSDGWDRERKVVLLQLSDARNLGVKHDAAIQELDKALSLHKQHCESTCTISNIWRKELKEQLRAEIEDKNNKANRKTRIIVAVISALAVVAVALINLL